MCWITVFAYIRLISVTLKFFFVITKGYGNNHVDNKSQLSVIGNVTQAGRRSAPVESSSTGRVV